MSDDWGVVEEALVRAAGNAIVLPPGKFQEERDKMRNALAALARLREREAQLAETAQIEGEGAVTERAYRNAAEARAEAAEAAVWEMSRKVNAAESLAARLEEALENECREAEHRAATWPDEYSLLVPVDAIRRALAHEEEKL